VSFDLDHYVSRIGWTGPRQASLTTLAGLLRAHMSRVPFENLDVLLGRGVRLDLDSVHEKLVVNRRGGYCFEHGTLVHAALQQLGFDVASHTARVITLRPRTEAPLTHMVLTARLAGRTYVLDPGFGGFAPVVPVPLESGTMVRDGQDSHRMIQRDGEWVLETFVDGAPKALWCSRLDPAPAVDFVMANHFVSTFPASPFVTSLMLRAITPRAKVSVFNRDLTVRREGAEERSVLADRASLRALLAADFGFDLPETEQLRVPAVPEWN